MRTPVQALLWFLRLSQFTIALNAAVGLLALANGAISFLQLSVLLAVSLAPLCYFSRRVRGKTVEVFYVTVTRHDGYAWTMDLPLAGLGPYITYRVFTVL